MNLRATTSALSIAALTLAGCNTTGITDGPDISIAEPYTMTNEQQQMVKENLKIYLKDENTSDFGPMLAGQFPNGQIMICGHIRAGMFKTWTAYSAYVAGERVWMGTRGSAAIAVCHDRNIKIDDLNSQQK
jgi:predicted small secreted protein